MVEICFLRLLRCRIQATSSITAVIKSILAIKTPIKNLRIDIQNSSSETIFFGGNRLPVWKRDYKIKINLKNRH